MRLESRPLAGPPSTDGDSCGSGGVPEWSNGLVSKTSVPFIGYPGFESLLLRFKPGEVSEWSNVHAWKACVRLKLDPGFESLPLRHTRKAEPFERERLGFLLA